MGGAALGNLGSGRGADHDRLTGRALQYYASLLLHFFCLLLLFYYFFHVYLNLLAEITRFGDRVFYLSWWKATVGGRGSSHRRRCTLTPQRGWRRVLPSSGSVGIFLSTRSRCGPRSIPHTPTPRSIVPSQACLLCGSPPCTAAQKLHVYAPMRRRGYSRMAAMSVVFLLSAFGHELFAALPLGSRRVTAFAGMLSQAPLSYAVEAVVPKRARTTFGRVLTMLALSVTPMAPIAVYAYDYIGDRW